VERRRPPGRWCDGIHRLALTSGSFLGGVLFRRCDTSDQEEDRQFQCFSHRQRRGEWAPARRASGRGGPTAYPRSPAPQEQAISPAPAGEKTQTWAPRPRLRRFLMCRTFPRQVTHARGTLTVGKCRVGRQLSWMCLSGRLVSGRLQPWIEPSEMRGQGCERSVGTTDRRPSTKPSICSPGME
jgi:hypothetical protein